MYSITTLYGPTNSYVKIDINLYTPVAFVALSWEAMHKLTQAFARECGCMKKQTCLLTPSLHELHHACIYGYSSENSFTKIMTSLSTYAHLALESATIYLV